MQECFRLCKRAGRLSDFGVADDDTVIGLEDPKYVSEKFSEIVKGKLDPVPEFSLSFENVDGKH